tara:strand:- start:880 stop:1113 length:234 start_codon:yes stop_codon:yes gene_type:complete
MPPKSEDVKAVYGRLSGNWETTPIFGQWWPQECDVMDMDCAIANLIVSMFVGCGIVLVTGILMEKYFKWKNIKNKEE